jgi:hypothetical protein
MGQHRCQFLAGQTAHEFSNEVVDEVANKAAIRAVVGQIRSSRTVRLCRRKTASDALIETQARAAGCKKRSFLDLGQINWPKLILSDAPGHFVRVVPVRGGAVARDVRLAAPAPSRASTPQMTGNKAEDGSA